MPKKIVVLTASQADVLAKQFFDKYLSELKKTCDKDTVYLLIESLGKYCDDYCIDIE